jgi:cardiolipin synthase
MTPAVVSGNRVKELINGDEIFPAMLLAVEEAKSSISFETYIYWSGSIGAEFSHAFSAAARRGVEVKVLLDSVGGDLTREQLQEMRLAGVDVCRYNPLRWANIGHLNNRTHRKLMIVDGRIGFIGGVGIADSWRGNAQDSKHWRDTHFRVAGPAVAQMQSAFIDNWVQTTGKLLHGDRFLPLLEVAGSETAQIFTSAPRSGSKSMQLLYLISITASAETIDLSASYFLPGAVAIASLVAAAQRGVRIRIIVPGRHMDRKLVRRASRATWGPLLAAGVEIFEFQRTMFHCKVLIVDRKWVSVGSTNFDSRSFRINDEANMNVYDGDFACRQTEVFERDLRNSTPMAAQAWMSRAWTDKALDRSAALLSSQL